MAKEGSYSISIVAIDKTTAVIDKINQKLAAMQKTAAKPFQEMAAPLKQLGKSMAEFSKLTGLTKFARGLGTIFSKLKGIAGVVGKAMGPLGALFGAGVTALLWKSTQAWAQYGHQIQMTSAFLGISSQQAQRMRQTGRVMGLAPDALAGAGVGLEDTMQAAVMQPGGREAQILKGAGIDPQGGARFQGREVNEEDYTKIATDIQRRRKAGASTATIRQLYGGIVGQEVLPTLMKGPEYVKQAMEQADKSKRLDDEALEKAEKENQLLGVFNNNIEQLTIGIGSVAAKVVNPLINSFNSLMEPTAKLGELFEKMVDLLSSGVVTTLEGIVGTLDSLMPILTGILTNAAVARTASGALVTASGVPVPGGGGGGGGGAPSAGFTWGNMAKGANFGLLALDAVLTAQQKGEQGTLLQGFEKNQANTRSWLWDTITGAFGGGNKTGAGLGPQGMNGGNANANAILAGMNTGGGANIKDGTFNQMAPQVMSQLMKDENLTAEQAAGVLGNFGHESAGFTAFQEVAPVGGGRGGAGWGMWTGPRRVAFEKYCQDRGLDPKSPEANYGFLRQELHTTESGALDAVRNQTSAEGSTQAFEGSYERAGVKAWNSRYRYAHMALDAYNKNKTAQAQGAPTGRAQVDINLNGFPKGTTTTASSYGDMLGTPRVATAMQSAFG